ncbi:hypothetical protein LCGC14_0017980 [marine sediment metagenome]|uniref:Uncharacterized protein n=1 Tax=marine sediment metagenome TaxID=412755 RepID=A0A0F9WFV3_9ZZZZ|nr:hypothetical protein [Phycisphaerae bacterium]HDZ43848.1 hypothetical protein [Phycisphaerae bacterium]
MFIGLGDIVHILLFVAGVWWCKEVLGRFRNDLQLLRELKERPRKMAIVLVWVATVVIGALVVRALVIVVLRIIAGLREL